MQTSVLVSIIYHKLLKEQNFKLLDWIRNSFMVYNSLNKMSKMTYQNFIINFAIWKPKRNETYKRSV